MYYYTHERSSGRVVEPDCYSFHIGCVSQLASILVRGGRKQKLLFHARAGRSQYLCNADHHLRQMLSWVMLQCRSSFLYRWLVAFFRRVRTASQCQLSVPYIGGCAGGAAVAVWGRCVP